MNDLNKLKAMFSNANVKYTLEKRHFKSLEIESVKTLKTFKETGEFAGMIDWVTNKEKTLIVLSIDTLEPSSYYGSSTFLSLYFTDYGKLLSNDYDTAVKLADSDVKISPPEDML